MQGLGFGAWGLGRYRKPMILPNPIRTLSFLAGSGNWGSGLRAWVCNYEGVGV